MTDEQLKELQEEYPNAWWNLNYEEYEVDEDDFYRAWKEDCGEYFDYCVNYEPAGWPDWVEENWDLYNSDNGDVYGNLMLNALYFEKWNIAAQIDSGDDIPRDVIMSAFFSKDKRKQMQWLLDHDCHRRDDALWVTWEKLCFEWDNP